MFKKPHIPLAPRTATHSYSLTSRSPRRRTVSTQTQRPPPPFDSTRILKEDLVFNEDTTKTYLAALEYVNAIHAYMNKKLCEKYGECGDTKPEANNFFKLPEVPNYATVFFVLLEKTKAPKLASSNGNVLKKKVNSLKTELHPKKYTTKESILEFVPEIKKLSEYKLSEKAEQEAQTIISYRFDDVTTTKRISDELSPFSCTKFNNNHTTYSDEEHELKKDKVDVEENNVFSAKNASHDILNNEETDKGEKIVEKEDASSDTTANQPTDPHTVETDTTKDSEKVVMMEIIKKRVQEEIITYLDKTNASAPKTHYPRLTRSHFHVVNIPPQINLLEYAQKKLERHLTSEPKPMTGQETPQKQIFNSYLSARKSLNIRPCTPTKVTNMFRKLSQENFRNLEVALDGDVLFNQSDEDSVILDDEEFEKINGHVGEQGDKKHKSNSSACREKSNPLKLTVRDMSKLNEKVLNTIGIFTERGDIRPEVIDILEEQKRVKAKDSRNKQFRSRRQWDLQIHLNPKEKVNSSFSSVSSEKSFNSLSSTDLKSELDTVKNVSHEVKYDL